MKLGGGMGVRMRARLLTSFPPPGLMLAVRATGAGTWGFVARQPTGGGWELSATDVTVAGGRVSGTSCGMTAEARGIVRRTFYAAGCSPRHSS